MTKEQLIGKVVVTYLRDCLDGDDEGGLARFLLDCLTAEQTAAIARAILDEDSLASRVEIKLPDHFVGGFDLPDNVLTNKCTTYFRNADCKKDALIVACTGDDERFSLKEMTPIGSSQLLARPEIWLKCVNDEIGLDEKTAYSDLSGTSI